MFETGKALLYKTNYQADGFDGYVRCAARRRGPRLVVSFTDASPDCTAAEESLRAN
ncbi:hypothetical protein [Hymenobacter sp. PAMC 26628]|uniref:hypothetical protein n=1 Tax=Hymenobacter sp. PAMC 26628 TaxID=1484118 RepID=UPI000AA16BEE|nr:hypothetical protein [Hymenobacter sp. PAMC 26628]